MPALIVYYSRADENYVNGQLKVLSTGNTEIAAGIVCELTGADLFKLKPARPYSSDYNTCIAEAKEDQRRNARPELRQYPETVEGYNTIYLGYPNYWGTMPMAVFTFLEHFDFSGKAIFPFCTHEGSGMGASEQDIRRLCPGARVKRGLALHGGSVGGSREIIKSWLRQL